MGQVVIQKEHVVMLKHKRHAQLILLDRFVLGIHHVPYWIVHYQANKPLHNVRQLLRNAQQMELIVYQSRLALPIRLKFLVFWELMVLAFM